MFDLHAVSIFSTGTGESDTPLFCKLWNTIYREIINIMTIMMKTIKKTKVYLSASFVCNWRCVHFPFFVKFCYISIILMVNVCVCIILVFANKPDFWRWRFPNMGIEGVELSKTDKIQKSYITIDVFKIMIYSQSG
jgi:hypothetical protein